ncbi:hypothetical protein NDU88_006875 [Pleurodeles waltl]|uniref:Zinc finger CCHC domain-containing protein n=1 Tax=Pleurodeles waltl TaxID=8319 RepID=A0AAV7U1D3_PLEWA|nr:hypothetical protein NDU88_006875 [Pleurodeles waltl]
MRWEVKDKAGPMLDRDLFLDKVIKPAGIPGEEVLSCQASASGWIFLLSFITHTLYRKYWEFFQGKKGEKPFNSFNISTGWEPASTEKRITVEMTNPHILDRDIASLLQRYGTIANGLNKVRDKRGIWNTTCQAIINLHKDPAGRDGLRHPPASFYLGADEGRIRYPGQPFTCRKCQAVGHKGIDYPENGSGSCRNPSPEDHQTKAGPLLKASREEAQKIPEPTRRSNPKEPAPQDHKSPGPDPEVEPTTVTDPAPPPETTVPVEPTHPEGTPENGTLTNAPPLEAQGELEPTPETRAEEGKESTADAETPTPTPAPAKAKKKSKHLKKNVDCSSGDKEEIEKAWKQVKSQRLREKGRKEKEMKGGGPGPKGNNHHPR